MVAAVAAAAVELEGEVEEEVEVEEEEEEEEAPLPLAAKPSWKHARREGKLCQLHFRIPTFHRVSPAGLGRMEGSPAGETRVGSRGETGDIGRLGCLFSTRPVDWDTSGRGGQSTLAAAAGRRDTAQHAS